MSDTKYYEDAYNKELHCKYRNEEHKECSQSHSISINQEDYERYRQAEYRIGYANGYSKAEKDYHKQISKDLQSSYDLGCITTFEKIIKLAHEDITTGNMIISLVDVEKLKDNDVLQTLININQI